MNHERSVHAVGHLSYAVHMNGQPKRKFLDSLTPAPNPRWHGEPVTPEQVVIALERAVEFKWDAYRAHQVVRTQAIAALTEQGMSVREVARTLQISKSLVAKQLKETFYEVPARLRDQEEERGSRTRVLVTKAWNGLWQAGKDPQFGTAPRRPSRQRQGTGDITPTNFGGTNGPQLVDGELGRGRTWPVTDAAAIADDIRQVAAAGGGSVRVRTDNPTPHVTTRQLIERDAAIREAIADAEADGFVIDVTDDPESSDVLVRVVRASADR